MWIKNYTASSVREALARIKGEMGANAVILDTRVENGLTRRSGGCGARVTVTAGVERPSVETTQEVPESSTVPVTEGPRTLRLRGELAQAGLAEAAEAMPSVGEKSAPVEELTARLSMLERGLAAVTETLEHQRVIQRSVAWWSVPEFHTWLQSQPQLRAALADAYAGYLLDRVPEPDPFLSRDRLPATVCFIGPPGCGKSTLMMKAIALRWRTHQTSLSVVDVVGDHVPSGGRLAGWAEAFSVDWKRFHFADVGRLSRHLSDLKTESVFIRCDLPGEDEGGERTAKKIIRSIGARATVLVLSALVRRAQNEEFMRRYGIFQPTHLCVSHWDLAPLYDDARHLSASSHLPLAYHVAGPAPCDQIEPFANADLRAGVAGELGGELVREKDESPEPQP